MDIKRSIFYKTSALVTFLITGISVITVICINRKINTINIILISALATAAVGIILAYRIALIIKRKIVNTQNSEDILRTIIESTLNGILVVNKDRKVTHYNSRFAEMWSIPETILKTENDKELIKYVLDNIVDPEEFTNRIDKLYNSDEVSLDSIELKNGKHFERFSTPLIINREIAGRVWNFHDITDSKIAERALRNAKERAEESDRLKSIFLANISHEIRTPLNAITGFTELLLNDEESDEKREYLSIIINNSVHLMQIINNILDLSKIESGRMEIDNSPYSLKTLFNIVCENAKIHILQTEKNIKITFRISEEINDILIGDFQKLKQILNNLLNNAVKFTDYGFIEFGAVLKNKNTIEFYVEDTGIGIPEDRQDLVFERFIQLDSGTTKKYRGTGLGLTISKKLIELMGGEIRVKSKRAEKRGTAFYFTLPYVPGNKPVDDEQDLGNRDLIHEGTILLIEDNIVNQVMTKKILEKKGLSVLTANHGLEGIKIIESDPSIDLVLLDIQMPGIDGYETANKIREIEKESGRQRIPIIALSAAAMYGDIKKCLESGCDEHIAKPVNQTQLIKIIKKHLEKKRNNRNDPDKKS